MAKRAQKRAKDDLEGRPLGLLIKRNKKVLKILDRHGVTFCAGCYLTLFSPPKKAAAYHAVGDLKAFLADLRRALR